MRTYTTLRAIRLTQLQTYIGIGIVYIYYRTYVSYIRFILILYILIHCRVMIVW